MVSLAHSLRRTVAALLCAALFVCLLSSCASDPTGKSFRYDIPDKVTNLDPQFATDQNAKMILANIYEGLLVQSPEGEYLPGVAERYTVSDDRLTYTFHLRPDAAWENGEPLTAKDFVFTFRRLFRDRSPHMAKYAAIEGADNVLAGGVSHLTGVRAVDDHTLVIQLDRPDPQLLEQLCEPAAVPCHQDTYEQSRGRYGLELSFVYGNGPFLLYRWDDTRLVLTKSDNYRSQNETVAGGVTFYIGRDAAAQFADGKSDLAILSREEQEKLGSGRFELSPLQKTVWCIVFNQDHRLWGNALLRQGLALSIDHELLGAQAPLGFQPSSVLVPEAMRVMGRPYRENAFGESPLEFDTQRALYLYDMGLSSLGQKQLPSSATILIPDDIPREALGMDELQQSWQKYLSAYINFEATTPQQIQNRLRTGEYQMLVMPMTPGDANVSTLLEAFASDSSQNYFGYRNPLYDALLQEAAGMPTRQAAMEKYVQAETMLLSDAVVIPLFQETSYLAMAKGVRDLQVSPFGDRIRFQYALKDG